MLSYFFIGMVSFYQLYLLDFIGMVSFYHSKAMAGMAGLWFMALFYPHGDYPLANVHISIENHPSSWAMVELVWHITVELTVK